MLDGRRKLEICVAPSRKRSRMESKIEKVLKRKQEMVMFGTLFLKECRQVLKSLVYYIFLVAFVFSVNSQMSGESWKSLKEPQPGEVYYGRTITRDETLIMEGTLANLMQDVYRGSFATYPLGFYKKVALTEAERKKAEEILERCTGKSYEMLESERNRYFEIIEQQSTLEEVIAAETDYKVPVREGLTYEEFGIAMEEICNLVGKGSSYEKSKYENSIYVPMTYEGAKEEFAALCTKDLITRGYMRLFCDYAGIFLSILPIFVGVSGALRDKRAKVQQVIFSKPAPGMVIIGSRYLANLFMISIPVFVMAFLLQHPCYKMARSMGLQADFFAFLKVPCLWLLPEIMIVLALSFFITEFTDSILAVFVQTAWGIGSLFGADVLVGNFGLSLVARWNTFGQSMLYASLEKELLWNRGYYCLLAVVCILLTVIVYERKRQKGGAYGKVCKTGC